MEGPRKGRDVGWREGTNPLASDSQNNLILDLVIPNSISLIKPLNIILTD